MQPAKQLKKIMRSRDQISLTSVPKYAKVSLERHGILIYFSSVTSEWEESW